MKLPYLRATGKGQIVTDSFTGLHLNEDYTNGSLEGGVGLCTAQSPGLATRTPPEHIASYQNPQALFYDDNRVIIADKTVYFDDEPIGSVSVGDKQIAAIGNKIIIFPDKVYIDKRERTLNPMEAEMRFEGLTFGSNTIDFTGDCPFNEGDGVSIEGCIELPQNNLTIIIRQIDDNRLFFDADVFSEGGESGVVTIRRNIPDMQAICESGNRLWGCSGDGVYSSKLGDPLNFNVFDGLSTDSYALEIASTGDFVACRAYSSHIMFFKTDMAYKLYGTRPSNYQLMSVKIPGVGRGNVGTIVTDNEDMYYLGEDGVYAYSGGVPQLLSYNLGRINSDKANAAVYQGCYYLSIEGRGTLTYDIARGVWLPWGDECAIGYGEWRGEMHMLTTNGALLRLDGGGEAEEWCAVLRPLRDGTGRYISCISAAFDVTLGEGAWLEVLVSDGDSPYYTAATLDDTMGGIRKIMLRPNRGKRQQIMLRGYGECHIRRLERTFRMGSDEL